MQNRTTGRTESAEAEVRRVVAALVAAAGGQRAFEREVGVAQATVSRFLAGGRLTMPMARQLHRAFPGLRNRLGEALFHAPEMLEANESASSLAAS